MAREVSQIPGKPLYSSLSVSEDIVTTVDNANQYKTSIAFDRTMTSLPDDWPSISQGTDSAKKTKLGGELRSSPLLDRENFGYKRIYGLEEYFTGADVFLFLNDKIVEEAVSIAYGVQENVIPIHGYASYTWDDVAYGTRIVQGAITVNYIYDYYLIDMINKAKPPTRKEILPKTKFLSMTPEELKKQNKYDYQAYAKIKADEIWGEDDKGTETSVINKYRKSQYNHDYCDIVISYGNEGLPLGECNPTDLSNVDVIKSQVSVINNARITGVQKSYSPSGDVLTETYSFIAQDVNNTIGQKK